MVLHADPDGHLRVLFPLDPKDDNFVRGGRKYEIRGRGGRESFTADDRNGRGTVYAAVSHDPFASTSSCSATTGTTAPWRRSGSRPIPSRSSTIWSAAMVDGSFDYDVLTYDVIERVVYADSYGSYDDSVLRRRLLRRYDCGYSYFGCGRSYYGSPFSVSVGLFFGRPYYRRSYYYDPYFPFYSAAYDPFYDPFFYDPYYYRPVRGYGYYAVLQPRRTTAATTTTAARIAVHAVPLPSGRRPERRVPRSALRSAPVGQHGLHAAARARPAARQRKPGPPRDGSARGRAPR